MVNDQIRLRSHKSNSFPAKQHCLPLNEQIQKYEKKQGLVLVSPAMRGSEMWEVGPPSLPEFQLLQSSA